MDLALNRLIGLMFIVTLVGCGTPETRWISCRPRPQASEIASYKFHDPFPDEEAGPKTFTRPRIFMEPRTDAQKSFDLRYIKAAYGYPEGRYAWDRPSIPQNAYYSVQPLWRQPDPTSIAAGPNW